MIELFLKKEKLISYVLTNKNTLMSDKNKRNKILKTKKLPIDFLLENLDIFDIYEILTVGYEIPFDYMIGILDKINWATVKKINVTYYNKLWSYISRYYRMTSTFCLTYWNHLNWDIVSEMNRLDDEVIYNCGFFLNWKYAQDYRNQYLSERVIKRYMHQLNLAVVAKSPIVDFHFIEKVMKEKEKENAEMLKMMDMKGR